MMRMVRISLTALVAFAPLSTAVAGQTQGTRLTVLVPHAFEGSVRRPAVLDRIEGDTIWVRLDGRTAALALEQAQARVRSGHTHGKGGAVIGGLVGAVVGGVVGSRGYVAPDRTCSPGGYSMLFGSYGPSCSGGYDSGVHTVETVGGAAGGLLVGLVAGWALGSMIERWTPLEVGTATTADGALALRVTR